MDMFLTGDGFTLVLDPEGCAWVSENEAQLRKEYSCLLAGIELHRETLGAFPKETQAIAMRGIISRRKLSAV